MSPSVKAPEVTATETATAAEAATETATAKCQIYCFKILAAK